MNTRLISILTTVILLTAFQFFSGSVSVAWSEEVIKIGGTGTGLGSIRLLGDEFEKQHPAVKVQIVPDLGGAGGILALLQGTIDLAVSGAVLNRDDKVSGITASEYARTPFVFIAHHLRPVV